VVVFDSRRVNTTTTDSASINAYYLVAALLRSSKVEMRGVIVGGLRGVISGRGQPLVLLLIRALQSHIQFVRRTALAIIE
jgi:hypothetical protein